MADERFKSITPSRVTPAELDTSVVQLHRWRPDPGATDLDLEVSGYGAIGRKP